MGAGSGTVTAYRFVLHCTPTAQDRTCHAIRCGHSVAYKSAGQKIAEATPNELLLACAPKEPLEGPLALEFITGVSGTYVDPEKIMKSHVTWRDRPYEGVGPRRHDRAAQKRYVPDQVLGR